MGREDAPRRLRRKDGLIFWPCLVPAEAVGAHPPGPPATTVVPWKKALWIARVLSPTSVTQPVYNILETLFNLTSFLDCNSEYYRLCGGGTPSSDRAAAAS